MVQNIGIKQKMMIFNNSQNYGICFWTIFADNFQKNRTNKIFHNFGILQGRSNTCLEQIENEDKQKR